MLGNYLITEDTTMKAFKKLMAAALVCVMALTMLTGCAVSDNLVEKALVNKLNAVSAVSYKHKTDLGEKAKKADGVLATSAKNSDKKIEIGVKVVGDDYVAIVAKAATKAAK